MNIPAEQISAILGGRPVLGSVAKNHQALDTIVLEGLPRASLDHMLESFAELSSESELRSKIVARATYNRSKKFNQQTSQTIERIARVYATAMFAFGDDKDAAEFMLKEHPELQDRTPFETSCTEIGGRIVEELLAKVMYGLPV